LAAYFFHNLFVFDNIMSYVLFTSVLAYITWRAGANASVLPLPSVSSKLLPAVALGAVVLVWGSAWYVNARPLAANRALLNALQSQKEGLTKNLEYFNESISYRTIGVQEAREQLVQATAQVLRVEEIPLSVRQSFLDTAGREMLLMTQEAPLSARFPLFLGVLLNAAGDHENAAVALEKAHQLSPGKQTILFELAANRMARGDTAKALATYRQAYELAPEFRDARVLYAAAAIRVGQIALAEELLGKEQADALRAELGAQ
jgi:tetratricopeptide (TPR) repeat protein